MAANVKKITLKVNPESTHTDTNLDPIRRGITDSSWNWICCNFRIPFDGIFFLLLLQLLIIGYYYTSFDVSKYLNKLQNTIHLNGIFDPNNATVISSAGNQTNYTAIQKVLETSRSNIASKIIDALLPVNVNASLPSNVTNTSAVVTGESILPICPPEPPDLKGRLNISFKQSPDSFEETRLENPLVEGGGHAYPELCTARHKVAIIIPFRDRVEHLQYFVQFMHPSLQRQQIDYQIFIINQLGQGKYNRAKLMNIGYIEALKLYPFECFAFHDVDLILEDDRSLYWCSDQPRHLSAGVDKFNYVLPYASIFGGVSLLSKEQMEKTNGFSNNFWGWGGEDDDIYNRLRIEGYNIIRYPMNIARYKMIQHEREKGNEPNPKRFQMIKNTKLTYKNDGIKNITYEVISIEYQPTYTNITVDVMGPP